MTLKQGTRVTEHARVGSWDKGSRAGLLYAEKEPNTAVQGLVTSVSKLWRSDTGTGQKGLVMSEVKAVQFCVVSKAWRSST